MEIKPTVDELRTHTPKAALCFVMPSSAPVLRWVGGLPLLFARRALTDIGVVLPRVAVSVWAGRATVPIWCPDALLGAVACSAFALGWLPSLYGNSNTPPYLVDLEALN